MSYLKRLKTIFAIVFVFILTLAEAKPPELTAASTKSKLEEILKAHVTHQEFNTEIAKRSLENYLDELDPTKTYIIDSEVVKYTSPSDELLNSLVVQYKKADFSLFEEIYGLMIKAIRRRNEIEDNIATTPLPEGVDVAEFKDLKWAKSEQELSERLLRLRALQVTTAEKLETQTKDQFLQRLNKHRLKREDEIIEITSKARQKQVLAHALKAICGALDTHTAYFTPFEANQFMIQVQQRLFGIGAQLRDELNGFAIIRLLDGGPALRCGKLKSGDRIIAVNHEPVVGLDIIEAVELIRGPQGSSVNLTILRELGESEEKFDIQIIRDEIVLKETRFETNTLPFGDGVIAHIRLFSFYQDPNYSSAMDIKNSINEIKEKHKVKGVILDLRNNAGGVLPQAVAVTGLFIKKGIVVSIKDNHGTIQHLRNFDGNISWNGPLIVLTNRGSASAAEIVAQTLQDYGRAIIVGDDHTFGKGTYQTFTLETANASNINPQGEYKVTRGLYYTVSGKSPQLTGTKSDVEVPGSLSMLEFGESHGKFPLENDFITENFEDTLNDIHPFHRGKMIRVYKTDLQEKINLYGPYLETLKVNSENRVALNQNYQNFLKEINKEEFEEDEVEKFGQNDLQLEETVNIMKDLILLSTESTPQAA